MEEENLTSSEALRKRILDLCKKRNISINHLAMMAGMPQTTVDAVVRGVTRWSSTILINITIDITIFQPRSPRTDPIRPGISCFFAKIPRKPGAFLPEMISNYEQVEKALAIYIIMLYNLFIKW